MQAEVTHDNITTALPKGWALKFKKKRTVFTEKQKQYMVTKFEVGKRTGNKIDPFVAAQEMQEVKENGHFIYNASDYLTGQQISSYFSRLSLKDKSMELADMKASEEEDSKSKLKLNVLKTISI